MLIFENFIHGVEFTIKFQVQKLLVTYFQDLVLMYMGGTSFHQKSRNLQEFRIINYRLVISYGCLYLIVVSLHYSVEMSSLRDLIPKVPSLFLSKNSEK